MKMFGFLKKVFFVGLTILSGFASANSLNAIPLSCICMNNQKYKTRPQNVKGIEDEPVFFPFSIETYKCSGSCNNINYPYARICVPDVVKILNFKVFKNYFMSRTNKTRHIKWHKTCKRECKFGANICNNKQSWNKGKCRCECKELIDKGLCNKGFIWNTSNCECECDKACDIGEHLYYETCKCRKKLVAPLINECAETVEEVNLAKISLAENESSFKCSSCTVYIVFIIAVFPICTRISAYFVYYNWSLVKNVSHIKFNTRKQTTIY